MKNGNVAGRILTGSIGRAVLVGTALLVIVGLLAVACAPQATPEPTEAPQEEVEEPKEEPAEAPQEEAKEPARIVFQIYPPGRFDGVIAAFNESHPDIVIEPSLVELEQLKTDTRIAIAGGGGPDLSVYQTGPAYDVADMFREGLIMNLDGYYEKYGWADVSPPGIDIDMVDGHYAVFDWCIVSTPHFFYNADIFEELGLTPPTTVEEFEQVALKIREAGYEPLAVGGKDKWPIRHLLSVLAARHLEREDYINLMLGWQTSTENPTSWTDPRVIETLATYKRWEENGVFATGFNAMGNGEASALFASGEAAMYSIGMWFASPTLYEEAIGDAFTLDVFRVPQFDPDIPMMEAATFAGSTIIVNAATEYPEEVGIFLDYMISKTGQKLFADIGRVPIRTDMTEEDLAVMDPLVLKILAWVQGGPTVENFDAWLTAEQAEAVAVGIQEIVAGTKTPEELAAEMEELTQKIRSQ